MTSRRERRKNITAFMLGGAQSRTGEAPEVPQADEPAGQPPAQVVTPALTPAASGLHRTHRTSAMASFVGNMNAGLEAELEALKQKFPEGTIPVRKIDPSLIDVGLFANRLKSAFDPQLDAKFKELLEEIKATHGNEIPALVRPSKTKPNRYELIYGERRWHCVNRLGFELLTLVADVDDQQAALLQHRENKNREDVSVVEHGMQVASWLAKAGYGSADELAAKLEVTPNYIYKLRLIGSMPKDLFEIHPDPRQMSYRAANLAARLFRDQPSVFMERLDVIRSTKPIPSAAVATSILVAPTTTQGAPSASKQALSRASSKWDGATFSISLPDLNEAKKKQFHKEVAKLASKLGFEMEHAD